MKRPRLPILLLLPLLITPAAIAFSAEVPLSAPPLVSAERAPAAVVAMQLASPGKDGSDSLLDGMLDLLQSDVEYPLNESTSVTVACNPFDSQDPDAPIYHPVSHISVGLRVSF